MPVRTIRVDCAAEQTVFEGWGTSLAWWANAVGRWPAEQRAPLLRRLFTLDAGGLGLTIARFNAGGGERPGTQTTMMPRAVMDGYRSRPGAPFDETADPGQRAVLREAAALASASGDELVVELFGNSPPWWMTRSGSVTGDSLIGRIPAPNLAPSFERDYLAYLAEVASFVERDAGVRVESISPVNEPTSQAWALGGRQEGCTYSLRGIDRLLSRYAEEPALAGGHVVAGTEEWGLHEAVRTFDALGSVARGVLGRLNTHTYRGASRSAVRARAVRAGLSLWLSEFGEGGPCGYELALAIVRDLRELAPSAWVLWQAVSPDDWGLYRLTHGGSRAEVAPKFEVFSRFTRSIRPGMRLLGTDDPHSVAARGGGRLAAVLLGSLTAEEDVHLDFGAPAAGAGVPAVVTVASALCGGLPERFEVHAGDGTVRFSLPRGAIASVELAAADPSAAEQGYRGCGTWRLVHGSGQQLGLAVAGDAELRAGVRAIGVAPDDRAAVQRWRAEPCGGGDVRWVCEASGCQLDVAYASRRHGAPVVQWRARLAEKTPLHCRFAVREVGDGAFELIARHSGLALALDGAGRAVTQRPGDAATRWRLVRATGARL